MPKEAEQCWKWFLELNETRPAGMGISAITYAEMQAYFNLQKLDVDPDEIDMIKVFDRVALKEMQDQSEKDKEKAERKADSQRNKNSKDGGP